MTRDEVVTLIREHLADELEVDPGRIDESTRFKEDLQQASEERAYFEVLEQKSVKLQNRAADIVQQGQSVKVVVLKLDREARKISLGLKQLEASPWDNIEEKYHSLSVVNGSTVRTSPANAMSAIG